MQVQVMWFHNHADINFNERTNIKTQQNGGTAILIISDVKVCMKFIVEILGQHVEIIFERHFLGQLSSSKETFQKWREFH